jgi:ABC-type arginine transport system permease subunit
MPQVWRFAIPGLGNVWLVLIKATAVTSAIGIEDLTRKAHLASGATHQAFLFFLLTALLYLVLTAVSNVVFHRAEKHANRGVRRA